MKTIIVVLFLMFVTLVVIDGVQDKLYKNLQDQFELYQELSKQRDSIYTEEVRILLEVLEKCQDTLSVQPAEPKKEKVKQKERI